MEKPKKKNGGARAGAGRHSKYKKEYCEQLLAHMAQGYSYGTFSAVIGVHPDSLYEWEKVNPEFKFAKEMAKKKGQMLWEKIGMGCATGQVKGSYSHWAIMGKNNYGIDISFNDKQEGIAKLDGFVFVDDV